jgi:3-hydroxybutyryl-CoA dehydrogenase
MGPLEWADQIGLKNVYDILIRVYEDTQDERYRVCPLLKNLVLSGENFYQYHENVT